MDGIKYLTPEEVAERYRGGGSLGTLRNWCSMRAWDKRNRIECRASKRLTERVNDRQ
ncbi:DNA-binding protein [Mesorhizobium caraganae]